MIIDCGGSSGEIALAALQSMSPARTLVVTHLHRDHYNALIEAAKIQQRILAVRELILPRIPAFVQSKEFKVAFLAMMARISRAETGVRIYDAAEWLAKVNCKSFVRRFVSENDIIEFGHRRLRVLWPPVEIREKNALVRVSRALEAYKVALESDEVLREEHKRAAEEFKEFYRETNEFSSEDALIEPFEGPAREIPKNTRKAERKLTAVANRLSLAFHDGSDLLVWGDQEVTEIQAIASRLEKDGLTRFNVMLTPHHGTYWPSRLRNPHAVVAITSAGKRLIGKFKKGLIPAGVHRSTYIEGTIETAVGWC